MWISVGPETKIAPPAVIALFLVNTVPANTWRRIPEWAIAPPCSPELSVKLAYLTVRVPLGGGRKAEGRGHTGTGTQGCQGVVVYGMRAGPQTAVRARGRAGVSSPDERAHRLAVVDRSTILFGS